MDELLVQSGKGQFGRQGSEDLGLLLGLVTGDGHFTNRGRGKEAAIISLWGEEMQLADRVSAYVNTLIAGASLHARRQHTVAPVAVPERNMVFIRSVMLARMLEHYGFSRTTKLKVPEVVWRGTEDCVRGYLRALFQADGTVDAVDSASHCSVRLASSEPGLLRDVQQLLANFGIFCRVDKRRDAGVRRLPDGRGGRKDDQCKADHELIIGGESRDRFMREIGFLLPAKKEKYVAWAEGRTLRSRDRFMTRVSRIESQGREAVFDTTQPDGNAIIFGGTANWQLWRTAAPALRRLPARLGQPDALRRQAVHRRGGVRLEALREDRRRLHAQCSTTVVRDQRPAAEQQQRREIHRKRRHGMGYLGLGSTMTLLNMAYGSEESLAFTEEVTKRLALAGWRAGLALAKEKGAAPIMDETFTLTGEMLRKRPEMKRDGYQVGDEVKGRVLHARYSRYMQRVAEADPALVDALAESGCRFTHHSSIAPTGTISLSLANNASNGIEPSFAHLYSRNVIREGKKSKEKVDVLSFELLAYRALVDPDATPFAEEERNALPPAFVSADDIRPGRSRRGAGGGAEVDRLLDLEDGERADGLPVRRLQGHLHDRLRAGAQGLHDLPLQPRELPGRARQGGGSREHRVHLHARGRLGGAGQGQRADRVRRGDAHGGEPLRRSQGRLLREILMSTETTQEKDTMKPPTRIGGRIVGYGVRKPGEEPAKADAAGDGTELDPTAADVVQMGEMVRAPAEARRLDVQAQDARARLDARDVHHDQRHRAQRGHRARAASPVRGVHQLEEPSSTTSGSWPSR